MCFVCEVQLSLEYSEACYVRYPPRANFYSDDVLMNSKFVGFSAVNLDIFLSYDRKPL